MIKIPPYTKALGAEHRPKIKIVQPFTGNGEVSI
jgi:hypothetical protein